MVYIKIKYTKDTFEFLSFIYTLTATLYDQTALKDFGFTLKKN
jgi:hypothetical protein